MLTLGDIIEEARTRAIDKNEFVTDSRGQKIADLLVKDIIIRTGGWWLYDEYAFTLTAGTASYAFPSRFMKPLVMFNTSQNKKIEPAHWRVEEVDIDRSHTGTPECYSMTYLRDVQNQPSSASQISVVSSSASDTAPNGHFLRLRGLDSDSIEVRETLSMNGTSTVTSTNSYAEVWACEKVTNTDINDNDDSRYVSNGQYTITSNAGAVILLKLGAEEMRRQHQWFRFYGIPSDADSCRLHFLRRFSQVSSNYDKLDIPDFLEAAAIFWLEWYIKWQLLDQRDEKTFNLYIEQCEKAATFLKRNEGERIIHGEIDTAREGRLYQPPFGHISRRAP